MNVALTYDDGPSQWTNAILTLLASHGAKATFFVTGVNARGDQQTLNRIRQAGHGLGAHGYNHHRFTELDDAEILDELADTRQLLGDVELWRAPYMDADERVLTIAEGLGLRHVHADILPADWVWPAQVTVDHVTKLWRDGSVVCLHDGVPPGGGTGAATRTATVEATRMLLNVPGVRYVTVTELLACV